MQVLYECIIFDNHLSLFLSYDFLLLHQKIRSCKKVESVLPVLKQIKESMQLSTKLSRINSKHYMILEEKVMKPK